MSGARPSGRPGSPPNGNGARTAAAAGSRAIPGCSGLSWDPEPDEGKAADPPAQCSRCGVGLDGARAAGLSWAQVWGVRTSRLLSEWLPPELACPCCGEVTVAAASAGALLGSVSYGPGVNTGLGPVVAGDRPPRWAARTSWSGSSLGRRRGGPVRRDSWVWTGPGRLTLADREEITLGLRAGESFTAIAARLGCAGGLHRVAGGGRQRRSRRVPGVAGASARPRAGPAAQDAEAGVPGAGGPGQHLAGRMMVSCGS